MYYYIYYILFLQKLFSTISGKRLVIQKKKRITHKAPQLKTQKLLKYMEQERGKISLFSFSSTNF